MADKILGFLGDLVKPAGGGGSSIDESGASFFKVTISNEEQVGILNDLQTTIGWASHSNMVILVYEKKGWCSTDNFIEEFLSSGYSSYYDGGVVEVYLMIAKDDQDYEGNSILESFAEFMNTANSNYGEEIVTASNLQEFMSVLAKVKPIEINE